MIALAQPLVFLRGDMLHVARGHAVLLHRHACEDVAARHQGLDAAGALDVRMELGRGEIGGDGDE